MNKEHALTGLGPIADEMLAGLHTDPGMRGRILATARQAQAPKRRVMRGLAPALCCAALAIACVGAWNMQRTDEPATARIDTIAAGDGTVAIASQTQVADLGDGAKVSAAVPKNTSLFATAENDIPLVTVNGAVYRMLTTPESLSSSLRGDEVGQIAEACAEPSLATAEQLSAGLSNVAVQGASVYAVKGVSSATAVAAEVGGRMRVFQRVSYAGKGPGKETLEDTFDVRGQVKTLELSGVGTLEGQSANYVMAVLLDNATLKSADATARKQSLTVTLESGLKLQLGVSGDTVCGCGGWSCPEFFEAFEAAL